MSQSMKQHEVVADWAQRLSRTVERWGRQSTWMFQAGVALVTGGMVMAVLVGLDGMAWPLALGVALVAMVPALLAGTVALNLARALALSNRQREALNLDDELTGVSNRRQFLRTAEREWARCRRYGDDGALLLIDTDHLRRINDSMGQRCGDHILLEITSRVSATLRQSDILARFSGAELVVFLPHTDPLGALDVAERIRQQVASTPFRWDTAHVVVTVSVGVAHVHAGQQALDGLIHDAEAALQLAKDAGRNCVRAAPIQPRQNDASRSVAPS